MTPEELDQITVDLLFALRNSLTAVSRLDFWAGRAHSALTTAAAGSTTAGQMITTACRKLQIEALSNEAAQSVTAAAARIDTDYEKWADHVARNSIYIVALANVQRETHKKTTTTTPAVEAQTQEIPY